MRKIIVALLLGIAMIGPAAANQPASDSFTPFSLICERLGDNRQMTIVITNSGVTWAWTEIGSSVHHEDKLKQYVGPWPETDAFGHQIVTQHKLFAMYTSSLTIRYDGHKYIAVGKNYNYDCLYKY